MKRKDLENELQSLLGKMEILKEESELNLATSIFLGKEADQLMEKANNPTLPHNEKEKVFVQMDALKKRIKKELLMRDDGEIKLKNLTNRFNELNMIFETGQIKED